LFLQPYGLRHAAAISQKFKYFVITFLCHPNSERKPEEFKSVFPTLYQLIVPDNAKRVNDPGYASQVSDSIRTYENIRGSISGNFEGFSFINNCSPPLGHKFLKVVNAGLFTEGKVKRA
jgi:hypothetical protein